MTCEETTNPDCIMRHQKQDESNAQIKQMFEIICGGLNPENSMKTKVDILFKDRADVRALFVINLTFIIGIVFWCGYKFAVLDSNTAKIIELEQKIDTITLNQK